MIAERHSLSAECPFAGLRTFEFEDRAFFFGREDQIYALFRLLDHSRFVAVIGHSGCGKSSLVRAGLIGLLSEETSGPGGRAWRIRTMRPGDSPIEALGDLLASLAPADDDADSEIRRERIEIALSESTFGIAKALDEIPGLGADSILLVVDQFEELFRFRRSSTPVADRIDDTRWRDEAAHFVQALLNITRDRGRSVHVIITMRSDFIGSCAQFQGLPEAVSTTQFLVPSLTRIQCEDVIRRPIETAAARIEPDLIDRLLNDASDEADQLPVLQHALARLWAEAGRRSERSAARHLRQQDYDEIGTISGAISQHANRVLESLPGLELAVEMCFRALSEIDADNRETRRSLSFAQLVSETDMSEGDLRRVLDQFRADDCSFIDPPLDVVSFLSPDTRIDVVHEALLRRWDRISAADDAHVAGHEGEPGWIWLEERDGRYYQSLLTTFIESAGSVERVMLPLDQVEERLRWWRSRPRTAAWAERYGGRRDQVEHLFQISVDALKRDRSDRERAKAEYERTRRRELRSRWLGRAGVVAFVLVAIAGLLGFESGQSAKLSATQQAALYAAEKQALGQEQQALRQQNAHLSADLKQETAIVNTAKAQHQSYNLGIAYQEVDNNDQAIQYLTKAISGEDAAYAYAARGYSEYVNRQYRPALKDLQQAVHLDPTIGPVYSYLGRVYYVTRNYSAAVGSYTEALAKYTGVDVADLYLRGDAELAAGDPDRAFADDDAAVNADKNATEAYYSRGQALNAQGNFAKAAADFQTVIDAKSGNGGGALNPNMHPDNELYETLGGAYRSLASAQYASGNFEAARAAISTAHVIEPTNAYAVLWMELIRWRQHDLDSKALARDALKANLKIWPGQIIQLIERNGSSKDINDVFATAKRIQDFETSHGSFPNNGRMCEAWFYVGEYLLSSRTPQAQ